MLITSQFKVFFFQSAVFCLLLCLLEINVSLNFAACRSKVCTTKLAPSCNSCKMYVLICRWSPDFSALIGQLLIIISFSSNIRATKQPARLCCRIFATEMVNVDSEQLANEIQSLSSTYKLLGCLGRYQRQGNDKYFV